ncbi:hypothetical protein CcaverHIS631_0404230 [Cutaneotrichosporon cavernicola]|nr:hypothetical protein CcaverHIS631_0404230 [Cutaneotrichosporon cavernicola]
MRIAIVGCLHGSLSEMYQTLPPVDLVLCCGDFQGFRNEADLDSCHVPEKYRTLGSFHHYYAEPRDIPLTIVVGGNHEASNYMCELFYGGWLAHNIYYLGVAGSVIVNGLRIAGASGIYNQNSFGRGHFERAPLKGGSLRSVYHLRQWNEERLRLLPPVDIFLSHDWPVDITKYGDGKALVSAMPRFRSSIDTGTFGAPPLTRVLNAIRARYWFAAHMHVKFPAVKVHAANPTVSEPHYPSDPTPKEWLDAHAIHPRGSIKPGPTNQRATRFLALSKPLPGKKDWWQVLDIPAPSDKSPPTLTFDRAWLAITKATHPFPRAHNPPILPDGASALPPSTLPADVNARIEAALSSLDNSAEVSNVQVFVKTAPAEGDGIPEAHYTNPQTTAFCAFLGIQDLTNPAPRTAARPNDSNIGRGRGGSNGNRGARGGSRGARGG